MSSKYGLEYKAVVTGATGFVATELIKQLLAKGFEVTGTVRDLNTVKTEPLKRLAEVLPGVLTLREADLLQQGSFDEIIDGTDFVFHTASPFVIEDSNPEENIVGVALEGTKNVFGSILKAQSPIKRVILTSSVAAVHGEYGAPPKNGQLYTEDDWNETSNIDNGQAYHYSKRVAEEWAWQEAKSNGIDLVSICPNFVLGPVSSEHTNSLSIKFMKGMLEGGKIRGNPIICDVRDVAYAHITAAESPSATGRYIISHSKPITAAFTSKVLRKEFPEFDIQDGEDADVKEKMDNSKAARQLHVSPYPPETTLLDMARTMLQLKLAKPRLH